MFHTTVYLKLGRYFQVLLFIFCSIHLLQCSTNKIIKVADTDEPLHAELIIRVVTTKPCITLYGGGTCSYQEAAIQLGKGFSSRELSYGCYLSKSGISEAAISTNKSESGSRIAYRCGKNESWYVIYLGSENRSFKDCKEYTFADNFIWTDVPDLRVAAPAMVGRRCGNFSFASLVQEMKQIGGESAVTDLLIKTISFNANRPVSMDILQAWDDVYLSLSASEKSKFIPVFRKAILEESEVLALERSVRYADLDTPEYLPAMIAHMRRIVNSKPHYETDAASEIILRRIAKSDPNLGAELGCRELEREMKRGAIVYLPAALLAVGYGNYSCPAVLPTLANSNCNANYFCPPGQTTHICESKDLKADIEKIIISKDNIRELSLPMRDKALLAASLPLKESRDILQLWQKRRSYTIEQPVEPACEKLYILGKKGVPCNCFKELPNSACGNIHNETTCIYTVDDVGRKIKDVVTPSVY